jgi:hypothetical protein
MMSKMSCLLFLTVLLAAPAFGRPYPERSRIAYLIDSIAALHDARFIRNGSEYDSAQAADHLRLKLRHAGSRVSTAEDFIVYCATRSSMSGEKYRIRFSDGRIVDTAEFLRGKLAAYAAPAQAGG